MSERHGRPARRGFWPWVVLALSVVPAVWAVVDYEHEVDPEFPQVARHTFNTYPPAAYRLAEAGDTIDCVAIYVSSAALVLSAWGCLCDPRRGARYAALALSAAAFWHAMTPGPLLNGWHGLGWRTIFEPEASSLQRLALAATALALGAVVLRTSRPWDWRPLVEAGKDRSVLGLVGTAVALMLVRQLPWIDREPFGYWPRWVYVWGLLAWALALLRLVPKVEMPSRRVAAVAALLIATSIGLDFAGRGVLWYQRPIGRLREIVPGRLYLSAMPSYEGLKIAQGRYGFKTIINLFPEFTDARSPNWPGEQRFARENGVTCYNQPADDPTGIDCIPETLAMANDPANWPVLVHCHASMDRSPAWVGMYRFVNLGWPLAEVIKEIEQHRGSRPKSSVTLLYNRMLPRLAPDKAAADPTAALFKQDAAGTPDPLEQMLARLGQAGRRADGERR